MKCSIRRLVVIRPDDKLGETLLATPVFQALREALPDAYLEGWVGQRWSAMVDGSPYLDKVRGVPFRPRGVTFWQLAFALRKTRFDACLVLRPDTRSYLRMTRYGRVPICAGIIQNRPSLRGLLTHIAPITCDMHQVERNLAVAEVVLERPLSRPPLAFTPSCSASLPLSLRSIPPKSYAVLHLSTGGVQPQWLPDRFARVADYLAERYRLTPVLSGAPNEQVRGFQCTHDMHRKAVNLVGKLSVLELAEVLRNAHLLISVDTGIVHLASALQIPCVSLHFRKDYPPHQWHAWQVPHVTVSPRQYCEECPSHRCKLQRRDCVFSLSVTAVCEAVDRLMQICSPT